MLDDWLSELEKDCDEDCDEDGDGDLRGFLRGLDSLKLSSYLTVVLRARFPVLLAEEDSDSLDGGDEPLW
ncbi:hypothetical protein B7Y94_05840 [Candidatus Saccharibacteria bacterium 32-49-12]|nr:MAG: hypothetical protein B7Y94_05840 [Candidatus Saccharibacteria bacterium 32-49-12]